MNFKTNMGEAYSPVYFLASLGGGGLAVSIYMYLMFMIEHPKVPLATYEFIAPLLFEGSIYSVLVSVALLGVLFFTFLHFRLLIWNFKELALFRQSELCAKLKATNEEVSLMAIPLTLAMSVNVCFVLGATFVPRLWEYVEYLFPFATLAFLLIGAYALRIYGRYLIRLFTKGDFDFSKNSSFSQQIATFAFAMVSVGLAAPGAMSQCVSMSAFALFFSIFFGIVSVVLMFINMILGFKSILKYGIDKESSVTLWVFIPIFTLLGIALVRISFGLVHNFQQQPSPSMLFILTSAIVSFQLLIGICGYAIMKSIDYFNQYIYGETKSKSALAIICPGVAFFVFGMFFITFGLLYNNVFEIFSLGYFIVLTPFVLVQMATIKIYLLLIKKLILK
ncbi:MAG: hypothetical protein PHN38_03410 [Sulfurospirillaceae bacterium]|nr:hypothetical protein [Sulfurospirillaceae bacterium]